jgi:Suppressor of fused protein (SUFU)
MPANHEIFLSYLEQTFGTDYVIKKHESAETGAFVSVFIYRDMPEPGMVTGITYGLSRYAHPEWRFARPEMILSVESTDEMWPLAAAYFCAEFLGKKRFSYGDVFTTDSPLASDTQMDGLLIFAQSILEPGFESVQLNDCKVHLSQFYPIYRSELEVYRKIGLERF